MRDIHLGVRDQIEQRVTVLPEVYMWRDAMMGFLTDASNNISRLKNTEKIIPFQQVQNQNDDG